MVWFTSVHVCWAFTCYVASYVSGCVTSYMHSLEVLHIIYKLFNLTWPQSLLMCLDCRPRHSFHASISCISMSCIFVSLCLASPCARRLLCYGYPISNGQWHSMWVTLFDPDGHVSMNTQCECTLHCHHKILPLVLKTLLKFCHDNWLCAAGSLLAFVLLVLDLLILLVLCWWRWWIR